MARFNRRAYRKQIEKLTMSQLREALVREAELRHEAGLAIVSIRRVLDPPPRPRRDLTH